MKATVVTKISINASQAEVFKYLSHLQYHYLWNPQVRSWSSQGVLKLGSTFSTTSQVLGTEIEAKNLITKFTPGRELAMENHMGVVKYRAEFQLTPMTNKTAVTLSTTLSTNSNIFIFTLPVLKKLALRELRTDMQALKIAVEHKLT